MVTLISLHSIFLKLWCAHTKSEGIGPFLTARGSSVSDVYGPFRTVNVKIFLMGVDDFKLKENKGLQKYFSVVSVNIYVPWSQILFLNQQFMLMLLPFYQHFSDVNFFHQNYD